MDARARDRGAGSGFSFADLAADQAGIEFAGLVLGQAESRERLLEFIAGRETRFRSEDYLPDLGRIAKAPDEGLGWKEMEARFGSFGDPRFLERIRAIREEVSSLPGFREASGKPVKGADR
jgi:hypothetical protein